MEIQVLELTTKKPPVPLEEPGVFVEKTRMRAEGLEPSTQGLKVLCSTD